MAKANRLYSGWDSQGRPVEVAERTDGVWFSREYGFNGFGVCWSKWCVYNNPYPETVFDDYMEWGFTSLRAISSPLRVRLPS